MGEPSFGRYRLSDDPFSAHAQIIDMVGKDSKVLDVGCSTGYVGRSLAGKGCLVVGMELDAGAVEEARLFNHDVIVGDIEDLEDLGYEEGYFDVIIFADILEHLRDPLAVLRHLGRYLDVDGRIICSLPNVAHFYNRINLLLGRWEYRESGLMDRTHLRFFTLASARRLVLDAGFDITRVGYTAWFPTLALKNFRFAKAARHRLAGLWPGLLAFQIVIEGRSQGLPSTGRGIRGTGGADLRRGSPTML